jgi:hypothetical protein
MIRMKVGVYPTQENTIWNSLLGVVESYKVIILHPDT